MIFSHNWQKIIQQASFGTICKCNNKKLSEFIIEIMFNNRLKKIHITVGDFKFSTLWITVKMYNHSHYHECWLPGKNLVDTSQVKKNCFNQIIFTAGIWIFRQIQFFKWKVMPLFNGLTFKWHLSETISKT